MVTPSGVRTYSSLPRWYEWLVGIALLLLAFGYFVLWPAAERLAQGVGGLVTVVAMQAAEALNRTHTLACTSIEQDVYAQALLGGELTCAPVEQVTWLSSNDPETVEFEFTVASDAGKQGMAHVVARMHESGPQFESIVLTVDGGSILILPVR